MLKGQNMTTDFNANNSNEILKRLVFNALISTQAQLFEVQTELEITRQELAMIRSELIAAKHQPEVDP